MSVTMVQQSVVQMAFIRIHDSLVVQDSANNGHERISQRNTQHDKRDEQGNGGDLLESHQGNNRKDKP